MPFVSITRLRVRSVRFLPSFFLHAIRSQRQLKVSPGFLNGALLPDRSWTFWTMTAWKDEECMRRFMTSGAHKAAMPGLLEWCDEASVVHWEQPESELPTWSEADRRMRAQGRASKVRHPSPLHATLSYRSPRVTRSGPILPAGAR
jgi:Domain of unknown function (DUF3291)